MVPPPRAAQFEARKNECVKLGGVEKKQMWRGGEETGVAGWRGNRCGGVERKQILSAFHRFYIFL